MSDVRAETSSTEAFKPYESPILVRIRQRFDYAVDQWKDIRDEGQQDMQFIAGDPWPEKEQNKREDAGRPCLVMDEAAQYINQLNNDIRQNKRAVKVVPKGNGATDKTAELRGDKIREIEYRSNAQSAYSCAFENMCQRSYGGWRILTEYENENSFDQEIRIKRIPNPDSSYPDPDCKEADYSDAEWWFLLDLIKREEFKRRWPDAQIRDFADEHMIVAPNWIKENTIQVGEYWEVTKVKKTIVQLQGENGAVVVVDKDDPLTRKYPVLNERETHVRKIKRYITNGVEILEEKDWAGKYIPIVWLTGKELYVDTGGGAKRVLMSLIRLARDPLMAYNYAWTTITELIGMIPKAPWVGPIGFAKTHEEQWQTANQQPYAYLQYDMVLDPNGNTAPPPQRTDFAPQIQPVEIARESLKQQIMSSMGISPLPTQALRVNEKSGAALKQIDKESDRGSFHFIDNYENALEFSGRIINDLLGKIYDSDRTTGFRKADDTHYSARINAPTANQETGEQEMHDLTSGDHDVTISTGPSFQSEREEAQTLVETLVGELAELPIDPGKKQQMLAYLIQLKNVGPIGDAMVKLLTDTDQQAQALGQLQTKNQQYEQTIVGLQTENQKLYAEKQGHVVQGEYQVKLQQLKNADADEDRKVKLAIAEIGTKAQNETERAEIVADLFKELHVHVTKMAHEAAMQAVQHAHEANQADKAAQNQQLTQASDQAHQAEMAANQPVSSAE